MNFGLNGKVALISGGSRGIGFASAKALGREGCKIVISARDEKVLAQSVKELQSMGIDALGVPGDVLIRSEIETVFSKTIAKFGTVHILVNNAGGGGRWGSDSIEDTAEEVWIEVFNKNTLAAARFTKLAIPFMRKQKWGRVITITSRLGREGGGRPWFNLAKSSETAMMKSLSMTRYLVRDGITFNCVAPGGIMIPGTGWEKEMNENPEKYAKLMDAEYPLGRQGTPDEVGDVVVFVSSERASLVNGASIPVDGGESRAF